jgi:hypothetical protein
VLQVTGDLNKPESMRAALAGASAVFLYPATRAASTRRPARRPCGPPTGRAF